MNRKTTKKGFTITELVIVIAVIAILASVLIPTFSNVVAKANESTYLQETTNAMKNYLANAADGNNLSEGMLFIHDKKGVDNDPSALSTLSNDIGSKSDIRNYYAYINNSLHKAKVLGMLSNKDVSGTTEAITSFKFVNTTDSTTGIYNAADFLVYEVEVNGTTWYGIASISGVKGYGSASKIEDDKIRVCSGVAIASGTAYGEEGASTTVQTSAAAITALTTTTDSTVTKTLKLQLVDGSTTDTIPGSWELR